MTIKHDWECKYMDMKCKVNVANFQVSFPSESPSGADKKQSL